MPDEAHLEILKSGVREWNNWRYRNPKIQPNLASADLHDVDLSGARLNNAHLIGANLCGVNLSRAQLNRAGLTNARLRGANLDDASLNDSNLYQVNLDDATLCRATLSRAYLGYSSCREARLRMARLPKAQLVSADFEGASLEGAYLTEADMRGAILFRGNLEGADLRNVNLSGADLRRAKFARATIGDTLLDNVDLCEAEDLHDVRHVSPSALSVNTLYRSRGEIHEDFLLGCGVPESLILHLPALIAAVQPIQFQSCFISYSGSDEEFARRLHSRMRQAALRVWLATVNMKGGDKLYDQIDRAIQVHDRLLLVLSESSLKSKWVELEIRRARKVELREGRRKLFPIRLVSYEALQEWVCIDSATGEDLAEEVRSYFIPDFSTWKSHDDFERAFARLLADLTASA